MICKHNANSSALFLVGVDVADDTGERDRCQQEHTASNHQVHALCLFCDQPSQRSQAGQSRSEPVRATSRIGGTKSEDAAARVAQPADKQQ